MTTAIITALSSIVLFLLGWIRSNRKDKAEVNEIKTREKDVLVTSTNTFILTARELVAGLETERRRLLELNESLVKEVALIEPMRREMMELRASNAALKQTVEFAMKRMAELEAELQQVRRERREDRKNNDK